MSIFDQLAAPFDPDRVHWRVGSTTKDKSKGMALAYVDARDVMQRLDDACGLANWQCDYVPMPNGTACCRITITIQGREITRANGADATGDINNENQREMAVKGGYSDAFKRAAVLFGVGRYLYDIKSPWVELETREVNGRTYVKGIAKHELPKLKRLLPGESQRKTAYQSRKDGDWKKLAEDLRACCTDEQVDSFLDDNADMIAAMPASWTSHWDAEVANVRQLAQTGAAA